VDPEAIAVAGISAGASMGVLLATLHPERFKAVVMHSGVPPGTAHSSASALSAMRGRRSPSAPAVAEDWPPLLVIHGSADRIVAPVNGQAAAQLWAAAVGAREGAPRVTRRGKRHAAKVTDFRRGARIAVSLHEIDRLGHAWSGGAAKQAFSDPQGPDASRLAWAFFARQLRARPAARASAPTV
jgi:poly(3-hydroxybutyrate) depolymerase